jgi:hypothetical protein
MEVTIRKTWIAKNKLENSTYKISIDYERGHYEKDLIDSAELLAKIYNGKMRIERTENALYINYLDIPNCNKIDTQYIFNTK